MVKRPPVTLPKWQAKVIPRMVHFPDACLAWPEQNCSINQRDHDVSLVPIGLLVRDMPCSGIRAGGHRDERGSFSAAPVAVELHHMLKAQRVSWHKLSGCLEAFPGEFTDRGLIVYPV